MNEIRFLHINQKRWEEFEKFIEFGYQSNPDKISDLYIHLTDDLAYARTYFPNSGTTSYLNSLAQKAHQVIYQNKPVNKKKIISFWKVEYPLLVNSSWKEIAVSFMIFFIAALIGWISNYHDSEFVRIILGDQYVNMTLANIEKGDPLAVYKSMNQFNMFLGISINNIYVSFLAFIFGLFTPLGTGYILLKNGIMLGTFHCFLVQKGFDFQMLSSVWIHGTLEIFSIIVAGAAGIIMGNSIVFPGTYSRLQSFRNGALKGIRLAAGLVPLFILAGVLEGFVTRYTEAPFIVKLSIIFCSVILIILYFFIYPNKITLKTQKQWKPQQ
jgi:uncharacterized membrane protein SpoIIM required for sporulation